MRKSGNLLAESIAAIIVFIAAYFVITFPLLTRPGYLVWGRPFEDAWESIGFLEWYKHSLFDLHVSPLFRTDVFYPGGWDLRYAILPPLFPTLLAPITYFLGSVLTYNITLLFTTVVAAYGTFLLANTLRPGWWAGLIAGFLYAFCPQREVYLGGHLNFLLGSMWLPWSLYGLMRALYASDRSIYWMLGSGICFGLSVAGAWQFLFLTGGAIILWGLGIYWDSPLRLKRLLRQRCAVAGFIIGVLLLLVPLLIIGLPAQQKIGNTPWVFWNADATSVSIERFFSPSWLNPLWRSIAVKYWPLVNGQDGVVNFSFVSLVLLGYGVSRRWLREKRAWWYLVAGGLILMLGPTLHVLGKHVLIPMPNAISKRFLDTCFGLLGMTYPDDWIGTIPVILPNFLLYWLIPPYRSFRHYGRWQLLAALGGAVLTAYVVSRIFRNFAPVKKVIVGSFLFVLMMLEFNTQGPITSTAQMRRSVDSWLAAQPADTVFVEYPLNYAEKGQTLYYTAFHKQKIVHGYSAVLPVEYMLNRPVLDSWPADETLDYLEAIGVDYILVNVFIGQRARYESEVLPQIESSPRLRFEQVFLENIGPVEAIYVFTWAK